MAMSPGHALLGVEASSVTDTRASAAKVYSLTMRGRRFSGGRLM
jgi:hypothetical protein